MRVHFGLTPDLAAVPTLVLSLPLIVRGFTPCRLHYASKPFRTVLPYLLMNYLIFFTNALTSSLLAYHHLSQTTFSIEIVIFGHVILRLQDTLIHKACVATAGIKFRFRFMGITKSYIIPKTSIHIYSLVLILGIKSSLDLTITKNDYS